MKPEQLVPSLETCRALREAGYPQDATAFSGSCFVWVASGDGERVQCAGLFVPMDTDVCAAPTLAELLAALPRTIDADPHGNGYDDTFHRCLWSGANGKDYLTYTGEEDGLERLELPDGTEAEEEAENPTEGAARLWLRLSSASLLSPARPEGAA